MIRAPFHVALSRLLHPINWTVITMVPAEELSSVKTEPSLCIQASSRTAKTRPFSLVTLVPLLVGKTQSGIAREMFSGTCKRHDSCKYLLPLCDTMKFQRWNWNYLLTGSAPQSKMVRMVPLLGLPEILKLFPP
eukprot:1140937-Pelagomonas_calceolata.AAC.2